MPFVFRLIPTPTSCRAVGRREHPTPKRMAFLLIGEDFHVGHRGVLAKRKFNRRRRDDARFARPHLHHANDVAFILREPYHRIPEFGNAVLTDGAFFIDRPRVREERIVRFAVIVKHFVGFGSEDPDLVVECFNAHHVVTRVRAREEIQRIPGRAVLELREPHLERTDFHE